jgi:hypothetical protein
MTNPNAEHSSETVATAAALRPPRPPATTQEVVKVVNRDDAASHRWGPITAYRS